MASTSTAAQQQQQQPQLSQNERFFRYFRHEVTALQEQMDRLADTALAGGERADAVDHCLAGIARLSQEVKDASSYVPAYDQRTYAEAVKALTEKLQATRSSFAPRAKFTFKTTHKNNSAISLTDAAELASQSRGRLPGWRSTPPSTTDSSFAPTPAKPMSPSEEITQENVEALMSSTDPLSAQASAATRSFSFSQASSITISNHHDLHIILPSSAAHATTSGTLGNLRRCIVDMSVPTASGAPFAGLAVKNVKDSLLVCGHVAGPLHITNVSNSVVVVASRQFRMHECRNVDVYLHCASRPIIEDCEGIRFAELPQAYVTEAEKGKENLWESVDDFKWLKNEQSPNWSILPKEDRIKEEVWTELVPGKPGVGVEEILKATGVMKS
ncbi:hypothetical protein H2199_002318 [Coniosporium tulheliwenetii]|uniref:Uncharacterized protein n=1 Tax=Coniosporium tulheliwenetii TaxID=3383036 RepID=A0ACC2ZIE8_9PEZI|nr:hypothetical protein H2199_002318 [Cladosporium sp. JES 115]